MRKIIKGISVGLLALALSSCGIIHDSDISTAEKFYKEIVKKIDEENTQNMLDMFSKKTSKNISTLENDINKLFDFVDGKYIEDSKLNSMTWGVHNPRSDSTDMKEFTMDGMFATTTSSYNFYAEWVSYDNFDKENVGLRFFYIEEHKDGDASVQHLKEVKTGITIYEQQN